MNRRNFIKTTGGSLGAILLVRLNTFAENKELSSILRFPDRVMVNTNSGMIELNSFDKEKWQSGDLILQIKNESNSLVPYLYSPSLPVKFVTLSWEYPRAIDNLYLGDEWERSYADLHWGKVDKERIMPWYFMEYNGESTNGFGVRTGCNAFCSWNVGKERTSLTMDVRNGGNGVKPGQRVIKLAEIIAERNLKGENPFYATRTFSSMMCPAPRLPKEPVYGINDWYFSYGHTSEKLILEHTDLIAPLADGIANRPFSMIDAGWFQKAPGNEGSTCWGDNMQTPNANFPNMASLAAKIKDRGMRPGIWTRPLCGSHTDPANVLIPEIPDRVDSAGLPLLDPTIEENLERVKSYFKQYNEWGYEMVKFDFTTVDILGKWGFQMIEQKDMTFPNWHFHDDSVTNAEIILGLYRAIREAAGETYLLACNTISHLAAGICEIQRIGDDTSGHEWDRTRRMGVNTLGFRITQHEKFYSTDGDCVGLTTQIPWEKNKQWMQLLAYSGTPLFVSAEAKAVGSEQKKYIRECFRAASSKLPVGEPLDWIENRFPSRWKLDHEIVSFNWGEPG
ncbi:MAG TPA: hypothetical protein VE912_07605 [Bacteroidales bacterium]|nr:hypothetical protein [Bacteroidales bacterium]